MAVLLRLLDRAIQPIWDLFTSVRFAVLFIGLIGIISIYGASFLPEEASLAFFQSWWFNTLLCILLVNLVVCTANKWPYTITQVGYLTVHLGLVTIIVGAIITNRYGLSGTLSLAEGERSDHFWLDRENVLEFAFLDPDQVPIARRNARNPDALWRLVREETAFKGRIRLDYEGLPIDEDLGYVYDLDGGIRLEVQRYLPNLSAERVIEAAPDGAPNPAVELRARLGEMSRDFELCGLDPRSNTLFVPGASGDSIPVAYLVLPAEADLAPHLQEGPIEHPEGTLRVEIPAAGVDLTLDVAALLGAGPHDFAGGYQVEVADAFRDPQIAHRGGEPVPIEASPFARNPLLRAVVTPPGGQAESRFVSAQHPDEPETVDGTEDPGVRLTYVVPPASFLPARGLVLLGTPDRPLVAVVARDGHESHRVEVLPGRPLQIPGAQVTVEVTRTGHAVTRVTSEGAEPMAPAFLVEISRGDAHASAWVPLLDSVVVDLGGQAVLLRYDRVRVPLAEDGVQFSLQLEDFTLRSYEGSSRPASFESTVFVRDPESGTERVRIEMNEPLVHRGFTFFQSSYDPSSLRVSTFSVSRDPGYVTVYAGFGILTLGVLLIFYLKPVLVRRQKERLAREAAARKGAEAAKTSTPVEPSEDACPPTAR